ncbi:ferredoxin--NADP reductase [Gaoshiqia sp. Z1-71]|uniref:ferredoxin--NADP reductase n=1 Tax=Gaoshiqia hydrogeniformans TaxID=3290090 RepID=UPI003BF80033
MKTKQNDSRCVNGTNKFNKMAKAGEYLKTERELFTETVLSNEEISPGVFLLSVNRRFDFLPGQVVKLAVDRVEPPRIYSICSGNREKELRILFNIKEGGYLTPKLAALIPGDQVMVTQPYGGFTGSKKPAWWIAAGTGIAPFYSMFQSGLSENKTLVHGVSYLNQFYFEDELDWAMGSNYQRCCSREQSCDVFYGRVTDYLQSLESLPAATEYYLCGKALMVVEVRDLLIAKGVPYENIIAEIYF